MRKRNTKGFTVIELLIATAVFSVVLIIFLTALIRISEVFYKGVNLANTQEATRAALQDISDDIQFYKEAPDVHSDYFCVGDHRYAMSKGVQVGSGNPNDYGLVREVMSTCKPLTGSGSQPVDLTKAEKLLSPGMQLNDLSIQPLNGGISIRIFVVYYGSDNTVFYSPTSSHNNPNDPAYDAYKAADAQCTGLPSSSQFCATADYVSTVLQNF
jgi:prepilin-type N-terminal cleavage/methylation domain-containing protein